MHEWLRQQTIADPHIRRSATVDAWMKEPIGAMAEAWAVLSEQPSDPSLLFAALALLSPNVAERRRQEGVFASLNGLARVAETLLASDQGSVLVLRPQEVSLGMRKMRARKPEWAAAALSEGEPAVVREWLCNPKLRLTDVRRLAAHRPQRGKVLDEIVLATRWIVHAEVRLAVAQNPAASPLVQRVIGTTVGLRIGAEDSDFRV